MSEEALITALVTLAGPGLVIKLLDVLNKRREQRQKGTEAKDRVDATVEIRLIEEGQQMRAELRDRVVSLEDEVCDLNTSLTEARVAHGRLEVGNKRLVEDNEELRAINKELRAQLEEARARARAKPGEPT